MEIISRVPLGNFKVEPIKGVHIMKMTKENYISLLRKLHMSNEAAYVKKHVPADEVYEFLELFEDKEDLIDNLLRSQVSDDLDEAI